jgi:hypothetical protein
MSVAAEYGVLGDTAMRDQPGPEGSGFGSGFSSESLILAQDERWRRA